MTKRLSIHDVAWKGNATKVSKFLKAGIDPNIRDELGRCPIHYCADNGHVEAVKVLLRAGADINARCLDNKNTALYIATGYGHAALARFLLAAGANANVTCGHQQLTPMHMGCINKHYDLVRELVEAGGDLTVKTVYGSTVLHAAVLNGVVEAAKFLVSLPGINLNVRDKQVTRERYKRTRSGIKSFSSCMVHSYPSELSQHPQIATGGPACHAST